MLWKQTLIHNIAIGPFVVNLFQGHYIIPHYGCKSRNDIFSIWFLLIMFSPFALARQFVLQGLFGSWIIVHRILNGRHFETIVALKLGKSFSSIVYLLVVVSEEKNTYNTTYILLVINQAHIHMGVSFRISRDFQFDSKQSLKFRSLHIYFVNGSFSSK